MNWLELSNRIFNTLVYQRELRDYFGIEIPHKKNVIIRRDCVGFFLDKDTPMLNYGRRSEVAFDFPFQSGDTILYSWKIKIPKNFALGNFKKNSWILGQWHDQPNKDKGETWENFPPNNPAFFYQLRVISGELYLAPTLMQTEPMANQLIPLRPNKWLKVSTKIKWSLKTDGEINIFVDERKSPHASL